MSVLTLNVWGDRIYASPAIAKPCKLRIMTALQLPEAITRALLPAVDALQFDFTLKRLTQNESPYVA